MRSRDTLRVERVSDLGETPPARVLELDPLDHAPRKRRRPTSGPWSTAAASGLAVLAQEAIELVSGDEPLAPGCLDKWIVPYLGRKRLRDITRQTIDAYCAQLRVDGAGVPTVNRTLGLLQGVFHRAVEWRRLAWNPVVGTRRLAHRRSDTIDARAPETVEAIRARLDQQNAALVSVLAYEGLRPAEA